MAKIGKRSSGNQEKVEEFKRYSLDEAVALLTSFEKPKFDIRNLSSIGRRVHRGTLHLDEPLIY